MRILATVLAIASGVTVLLGYFYPVEPLLTLRLQLTNWAIILAGFAALIGIYNLVVVQMEKIRTRQKGAAYSGVLVISLILTAFIGLVYGPDFTVMRLAVDAVVVPVEASLMAILSVTLIYASMRLLRRRADVMSIVFLLAAVVFLIGVSLPMLLGGVGDQMGQFILQTTGTLSRGGARGLLLGISLGTLLTGLRVIFGVDRPYGGN
jgi:hypothetical protein